jgi:hypothetical protein
MIFNLAIAPDRYFEDWEDVHRFLSTPDNNLLLSDKPSLVQLALDNGFDPSSNNNKAIVHASSKWYKGVVKLLLEDGRADPTVHRNQALLDASSKDMLG